MTADSDDTGEIPIATEDRWALEDELEAAQARIAELEAKIGLPSGPEVLRTLVQDAAELASEKQRRAAEAVPQAALERIIANLTEDRDDARRLAKSWSESSALWLGSWERLIGELGELANVVRARPEGSRCATVEELDALLTRQADDPAMEPAS